MIGAYICLGLFIVASVIHLIFCFLENEKARKISKPFCLLFLTVAIVFIVPQHPLIWLFPIFSWIGDIFLIWKKKGKIFFILGTISFALGHLCNLAQMIIFLVETGNNFPPVVYIVFAIFLVVIMLLLYPITTKLIGKIAILGNIYMPLLISIGLFALIVAGSIPNCYLALLTFGGYLIFVISDGLLIYTGFVHDIKRRDFYIMVTYLLSEAIITITLSMIALGVII